MTVHQGRAVKRGGRLFENEASNLRFIAEHTTIPVPHVYGIERDDRGKVISIEMDYMPGRPLDQVWEGMTENQRDSITQELHGYVAQLRSLKGSYIGAADHGQAVVGDIVSHEAGPFEDEHAFNEFLFSKIIDIVPDALRYYATSTFREDHEIVFTHGDLAPRNILVDDNACVTAILDWEEAGWYPAYWEHVRAYRNLGSVTDWSHYLSLILPPQYPAEFIAMAYLTRISS